jgi:serine protease Do
MIRLSYSLAALLGLGLGVAHADTSFAKTAKQVNEKVVKLFGAGGIRGLPSYGTGVLVSPDGYILTASNHILETQELRVHLSNGLRYLAEVVANEPELDVALVKIKTEERLNLPYFDVFEAVKRPMAEPGTGVLAFSNQFLIATRAEALSVQRGRVASVSRLQASRGITQAPYNGDVYVVDAITNNPGAAGGALTTRKGELLGLLGKELRNDLTNTWMNYAVPINAKVTVTLEDGKQATRSIVELVEKKEKYVSLPPKPAGKKGGGFTGIQLVANVLELTPPYIEEVEAGSPAAKAGLKPDDLIVYVNGLPVNNIQAYEELMDGYKPGDEIKLEVQRNRRLTTISIKLEEFKIKPKRLKKPTDDAEKDK